jgi:hypothetical protein
MRTETVSEINSSAPTAGHGIPAAAGALTLSDAELEIGISMPGVPGTYCGSRFSWAGIISHVKCGGHRLFGPWRPGKYSPDEHDNVTGTAGEFGMGIADMPSPLGFNDAAAGGHFVKIGVGVLRRPDMLPYSFARSYDIVDAPHWQVRQIDQGIDMRQVLAHDAYGYDYCHRIELVPGSKSFVTRHTLTNTGRKVIHQTHYSHNFMVIDELPIGSDYEVMLPFSPKNSFGPDSVIYVDGRSLKFRTPIPVGEAVFTQLSGFGDTSVDNQVTIRNRKAGVDVRITGDRPVLRYHFFAVAGALCPEPFVDIHATPGETVAWQHRYDIDSLPFHG